MPIFEAPAVYAWSTGITICTYMMEHLYLKDFLDFHTSDANIVPLSNPTSVYYIRRERADRQKVVNVFNGDGEKVYTIERKSPLNPVWSMYAFPSRRAVATIRAGFFLRAIDFHNKQGLQHRAITNESGLTTGRTRSFYLNDGAKYSWTRGSKFLEKIINPKGGDEEIHERLAKVKLMRQWKFDFEMVLDEAKIDREVALSTAFISMLTQWGFGDITETRGPTYIPKKTATITEEQEEENKAPAPAPVAAPVAAAATVPASESTPSNVTFVINSSEDSDVIIEGIPANKKSWTGCGKHIANVMENTSQDLWCSCRHIDDEFDTNFPPKAGTGKARSSVSSGTSL
ncbi:hypothetical protein PACTADRAFT_481 [Pachysolen tannophilus NRRL Y-2460]|uniref:Uncharacterized protein n=1 Tax=Pachysolen tannophilus NRRL Y-2460 TaxID=669874 RepID=A0A1E4U1X0_PACTA|nr:hypothetical protein PACTADRAFT_481 [Pachysolen tannophilus NRRL Y-2460]